MFSGVNYVAVIVVAIVQVIIGMIWYSPAVFGKAWMRLSGISKEEMDRMKKKGMSKSYVLGFIAAFVMGLVLSALLGTFGVAGVGAAASVAFWMWLGFVATSMIGMVLWEGRPNTLYLINAAYFLVSMVVMSAILYLWS